MSCTAYKREGLDASHEDLYWKGATQSAESLFVRKYVRTESWQQHTHLTSFKSSCVQGKKDSIACVNDVWSESCCILQITDTIGESERVPGYKLKEIKANSCLRKVGGYLIYFNYAEYLYILKHTVDKFPSCREQSTGFTF